jgi:endonuclease/exonuclease/phosphatase family metal-dependent hydrolase
MEWSLRICLYNVMLTLPKPIRYNGQEERAKQIPDALEQLSSKVGNIDVFVFVELIAPSTRKLVLKKMKKLGWKFSSSLLSGGFFSSPSLKFVSGGVVVVSKYPIVYQKNHVFQNACEGTDCWASKGAVFCRILKNGRHFGVLGSHFQAWDTPPAKEIRAKQAQQCRMLIDSMGIDKSEPVIITGDFNVDIYTRPKEIQNLMKIMEAKTLPFEPGSYEFSCDPATNHLVGNDEDSMYATESFPRGCYQEYLEKNSCPCCPQQWLDYFSLSKNHGQALSGTMFVELLKSKSPFKMKFNATTDRTSRDLSDHYPVIAEFRFDTSKGKSRKFIGSNLQSQNAVCTFWIKFWCFFIVAILFFVTFFTVKKSRQKF